MNLWMAFLLGLFGSLHCAGMCGPLAVALPAPGKTTAGFMAGRLVYNLGRIFTYCFIGIIFGALGKSVFMAGIQQWVSIAIGLLLIAGLITSRKLSLSRPVIRLVERLKLKMAVLIHRRSLASLFVFGLLNGWLPCGLVYIAAATATLSGNILGGLQFMFLFGLGTVPMMLILGFSRRLMPIPLRLKLLKTVPVSVFILALLLILRGMSLGIPYVSPDLNRGICCFGR